MPNVTALLNIERSILSTIIFNQNICDVINILESKDFYFPIHRTIYTAMLELYKKDLPIDEEFIRSRAKINDEHMLEILTSNPISNIVAYAKEIQHISQKRALDSILKTLNTQSANEDISADSLLLVAKQALSNFENNKQLDTVLHITDFNSIAEHEPKFYLENILPIQDKEINIISAKGGSGKSYTTAYLMLELANKHNLKCFGWFSEDAVGTTKKRINSLSKLHNLPIENITIVGKENRAIQFVSQENKKLSINNLFYILKKQLKDFDIIVLDPLIAFFGADENSNADARYFMNLLNEWCEKDNKTIILIHHHSKGEGGTARGAGAFVDACRIHYILDYKYIGDGKDKKVSDTRFRTLKIDKTNHFSGKKEYDVRLFENTIDTNTSKEVASINEKNSKKFKKTKEFDFEMPNMFQDGEF